VDPREFLSARSGAADDRCPTCGHPTRRTFPASSGPGALVRALKVSIVVGTGLVFINQGDVLFAGASIEGLWWKIPLTYSVPFFVSLYSSVSATRSRK
jgi:hypothetical protein